MADNSYAEKVKEMLKKEAPASCSQEELAGEIFGNKDRREVAGYLKCMVDLGKIKMKPMGKTKSYFLNRVKKK